MKVWDAAARRAALPIVLLVLTCGSATAQQVYNLTDLGTLGGEQSFAYSINSSGQITGNSDTDFVVMCYEWGGEIWCLFESHAFIWDRGVMRDIGARGTTNSAGHSINDQGQIAGTSDSDEIASCDDQAICTYVSKAFRWEDGVTYPLGETAQWSEALSINKYGAACGSIAESVDPDVHRAVVWDDEGIHALEVTGSASSWASAINDSGQVVGRVHSAEGDSIRPILWDGYGIVEIGSFGGTRGHANDINVAGKVTGTSYLPDDTRTHAYVWDREAMVDIGTLPGGLNSVGYSINKAGDVAGKADISGVGWRAFLWNRKQLFDLNELVEAADPLKQFVTLTEARGINDRGWIVANGTDGRTGQTHGYLLTPLRRKK